MADWNAYAWSLEGHVYHMARDGERGWVAACGAWIDRTSTRGPAAARRLLRPCQACWPKSIAARANSASTGLTARPVEKGGARK